MMPLLGGEPGPLDRGDAGRPGESSWRTSSPRRARLDSATRVLDGIGGLGWSVIGFVVGAVFWHFIGFWSFMAEVVLAGGPPSGGQRPEPSLAIVRTVAPHPAAALPACTMLTLDRRSGATSASPCGAGSPQLPADRFQGREDRFAAARGQRRP